MPPPPWKTLTTREVYRNRWMRLREDIAELPNGRTTIYGVCEFGQCVGVLPFVTPDDVVLVRQYRYVQRENSRWEMPTGGVHPGAGTVSVYARHPSHRLPRPAVDEAAVRRLRNRR